MSYTNGLDNPELYFQTKLYAGTGGNSHAITFDGSENMQPDWVWIKARNSNSHRLTDSVRGATKILYSDLNFAEVTDADTIQSFDTDGFTIDDDADTNGSGINFASWNWKAGGSASSNSDGSITSTVSANTTAGFSIVSYTGNGSAGATIGHGLGAVPQVYILKNRSSSAGWTSYFEPLGNTKFLQLDTTGAAGTATEAFNNTSPTSSVFSIGTDTSTNNNTDNFIAYCFAEKKGYSKFGSYTGNGNADGVFVYLGFKPSFVMTKCTSASGQSWHMQDNKRDGFNYNNHRLFANSSGAEETTVRMDLLSNGFKYRDGDGQTNGATYIFMAFSESSFVNSKGVPNNAR